MSGEHPALMQVASFIAASNPRPEDILGLANVVGRLASGAGISDEVVAAAVLDGWHAPLHRPEAVVISGPPDHPTNVYE